MNQQTSRRDAMKQVLAFIESIEGAGYGGMNEFEIARMTMRDEVGGIPASIEMDYLVMPGDPRLDQIVGGPQPTATCPKCYRTQRDFQSAINGGLLIPCGDPWHADTTPAVTE